MRSRTDRKEQYVSKRNPHTSKSHWRAPDGKEYKIVDADPGTMILVQPTKQDVACAVKRDPRNCAIAQAWKRQADVPVAQIGIDKCYLPMRRGGEIVALRLKTTAEARRIIDHFDRTGKFPTEGIVLRGIPASEGMESKRSEAKRARARWAEMGKPDAKPKRKSIHLRNAATVGR